MTSTEIKESRLRLGLTLEQLGTLLGYSGAHVRGQMHKIENGDAVLMPCQARLLQAYVDGYRPSDWPV